MCIQSGETLQASPAAGTNVTWNEIGGDMGTEAGAHGYKCFDMVDVAGCDKPARPPALQVQMSRVRWRAGGLAGRGYQGNVECD